MKEISMLLCLNIILLGKRQSWQGLEMVGKMLSRMSFGKMELNTTHSLNLLQNLIPGLGLILSQTFGMQ